MISGHSSATGQSADATAGPAPAESSTPVRSTEADALLREAKTLLESGDRDAAVQRYQQVMTQAAGKPIAQQAALRAGICLEEGQRPNDALAFYEQAAAGKTGYFRTVALYCKARSHYALGQNAEALQLLRLVRAESPIGKHGRQARLLQSHIEGLSEADAQALVARDEYAANIYRQGRDALKAGNPLLAVQIFHEVLSGYGDTGAGFQSLRGMGEAFWHLNRYDEMCQTYSELRQRIRALPNTPHWRGINRTIDCRVGWYRAGQLSKELIGERQAGKTVPDERWDRLRVLCDRWKGNVDDAADRADADVMVIESLCWQGKPAETLDAAQKFIAAHGDRAQEPRFKRCLAWACLYGGDALHRLGRYDEALAQFRRVLQTHQSEPENWRGEGALCTLYWRIWHTGRKAGAKAEAAEAARTVLSRWPDSPHAAAIRRLTSKEGSHVQR
jgi:tetratricopeptide (TPR) repeat protein